MSPIILRSRNGRDLSGSRKLKAIMCCVPLSVLIVREPHFDQSSAINAYSLPYLVYLFDQGFGNIECDTDLFAMMDDRCFRHIHEIANVFSCIKSPIEFVMSLASAFLFIKSCLLFPCPFLEIIRSPHRVSYKSPSIICSHTQR